VHLLDTYVAGWQYHKGDRIFRKLKPGTPIVLEREPQNPYDELAIALYGIGIKIGYIPRVHNTVIANLMDQGLNVHAYVASRHPQSPPWERLVVSVCYSLKGPVNARHNGAGAFRCKGASEKG
ncbi:MAG: HIRAN domain-containing protein, partial [Syntrophales bacterium]|nr:HIRAN domain-containing protein [Syntrophales bacterium]